MAAKEKSSSWRLQPTQLLWKLNDRARQTADALTLSPTAALGRQGEDMAHRYLQRAGFKVISRNCWPGTDSEIDIVARRGELLVFVEVKTRTTAEHSAPERAIDDEKERHILRAARAFVTRAGADWDQVRFDVISVVMSRPPVITHRENTIVLP